MFYSFQTEHNGTWILGRLDSWQNGSMAVWIHSAMDAWQFGFMALWMNSSLDSWPNGCIAVWIHATMDVWQFGCMVFSKTSPTPSPAVQNQNTLCTLTLIYSKSPKTKNSKTFWRLVIFCRSFNLVDR